MSPRPTGSGARSPQQIILIVILPPRAEPPTAAAAAAAPCARPSDRLAPTARTAFLPRAPPTPGANQCNATVRAVSYAKPHHMWQPTWGGEKSSTSSP